MSTEQDMKHYRTQAIDMLIGLGVPVIHANNVVAEAIIYRDTVKKLPTLGTFEERMDVLLDLSDAAIRNSLVSVFVAAESGGVVSQQEVAEVALSTHVSHASHGCLMMTKNVESAVALFEEICTTAFHASMEAQKATKEGLDKIMEMGKILREKKNAPIH